MFHRICYEVTEAPDQPVVEVFLKLFETKGQESDKATIHSQIRITTFENRDDEDLFPKVRKMALSETFVENYAYRESDGIFIVNQEKDHWVIGIRHPIVVKFINEKIY